VLRSIISLFRRRPSADEINPRFRFTAEQHRALDAIYTSPTGMVQLAEVSKKVLGQSNRHDGLNNLAWYFTRRDGGHNYLWNLRAHAARTPHGHTIHRDDLERFFDRIISRGGVF